MANTDQPMIISQGMVSKSLADAAFYQQVPEFTPFKTKLTAMHIDLGKPGGCSGCKQRRVQQNLYGDYVTLVQALSADGLERIKRYFGTQRFMVNVMDPKTRAVSVRIF